MVQAKRKKKQKTIPRNSELIDQLASEYYIKATPELDRAAEIAHKIYNAALYQLRQALSREKDLFIMRAWTGSSKIKEMPMSLCFMVRCPLFNVLNRRLKK